MVSGWRRVFCTAVPKEELEAVAEKRRHKDGSSNGFSFFSTPATPRCFRPQVESSSSPVLRCRTTKGIFTASQTPTTSAPSSPKSSAQHTPRSLNSPGQLFQQFFSPSSKGSSNGTPAHPASPMSPSALSFIKSRLRLYRSRCGICSEGTKSGGGATMFTAECGHMFHFHCVVSYLKSVESHQTSHQLLPTCPVCGSSWREPPILSAATVGGVARDQVPDSKDVNRREDHNKKHLRVYDDDEPLTSPSPGSLFVPIPENDDAENEDDDDESMLVEETNKVQGFLAKDLPPARPPKSKVAKIPPEVSLLPESAVISAGRTHETRCIVVKVKGPHQMHASPHWPIRHTPLDLVALLDMSDGSSAFRVKTAMGIIISSLGPGDRLSIVVFSGASKRLLPLMRMTGPGKRSARRVVDTLSHAGRGMSVCDALKKAVKVIGDRRERNPCAGIVVISPSQGNGNAVISTTRLSDLQIPVHWLSIYQCDTDMLSRSVNNILNVAFRDVTLQLRLAPGSAPGEITAVYPLRESPCAFGPRAVLIGSLHAGEEQELLAEIKVPRSSSRDSHVLLLCTSYVDCSSHVQVVSCKEQVFLVPHPSPVRATVPGIQRLRNFHVTTSAIAESRRHMMLSGDVSGAYHLLSSARALVMQSGDSSAGECLRGLEAELSELYRRWRQSGANGGQYHGQSTTTGDDKDEPITPTSAWRTAERLAKVAIMRKHLNKVSDLHGFENARF